MSKGYEVLIASSITVLMCIFFKLDLQPDGIGKLFSFFGIAVLPTAYFQIRTTIFSFMNRINELETERAEYIQEDELDDSEKDEIEFRKWADSTRELVSPISETEQTPWFWMFSLGLNTLMVGCVSLILYFVFGILFTLFYLRG